MYDPIFALLSIRLFERSIILLAGLFLIYLGYRLFILGVSGEASLKAKNGNGNLEFLNAAPGLFFCLFGFALLTMMSFKSIEVSIPGVDGGINVLLADALEDGVSLSTDGPIQDTPMPTSAISQLGVRNAMEEVFRAISVRADELDFAEKQALVDSYGVIFSRLQIEDQSISPRMIMERSEK